MFVIDKHKCRSEELAFRLRNFCPTCGRAPFVISPAEVIEMEIEEEPLPPGEEDQPRTGSSQDQEQKQEEPVFVTPSFLQPPGQEQSQAEIDSKKKAAEAAPDVLSKKNIQPEESKKDKNRPVSRTPVPGTPWCVVWTGDSRSFFFNPSNKQSVWEKPAELVGRSDVAKMLESPTAAEEFKKKQQAKVKSSLILKIIFTLT